jgi:hypothetical protein
MARKNHLAKTAQFSRSHQIHQAEVELWNTLKVQVKSMKSM